MNERRLFSVLMWPSLEAEPEHALEAMRHRTEVVMHTVARGAAEVSWSLRFDVDHALRWDHERQVWVSSDGYHYAPPPPAKEARKGGALS